MNLYNDLSDYTIIDEASAFYNYSKKYNDELSIKNFTDLSILDLFLNSVVQQEKPPASVPKHTYIQLESLPSPAARTLVPLDAGLQGMDDLAKIADCVERISRYCRDSDEDLMKWVVGTVSELLEKNKSNEGFVYSFFDRLRGAVDGMFTSKFFFGVSRDKGRILAPLFELANTYISLLPRGCQAVRLPLKLALANIPKPKPPEAYPNLLLTEKEKLHIVLRGIAAKERGALHELYLASCDLVCDEKEFFYLAKLVSDGSGLSLETRNDLRAHVTDVLACEIDDWNNSEKLLDLVRVHKFPAEPITSLYRLSKVHAFFERQKECEEGEIFIPQWYHATTGARVIPILESGEIEVRKLSWHRGAFVSTQREEAYGKYCFALNRQIVQLDLEPHAVCDDGFQRWRGLQKAISLRNMHFGLLSYPKYAKAEEKPKLKKTLLDSGYTFVRLHSHCQLDFMQKVVADILGCPDLPDGWLGGREKLYSLHQLHIRTQAKDLANKHKGLFTEKASQVVVSKVIQQLALPLYKEPMPANSSYRIKTSGIRFFDGRNVRHAEHVKKLAKKEVTARSIHGTMHAARVALWSQLLRILYNRIELYVEDAPVELALTAALHDAAREGEGIDHWDEESAELVAIQLEEAGLSAPFIFRYKQAVSEKDPIDGVFSTNVQAIIHDADCLDIMRLYGYAGFQAERLYFYDKDPESKGYFDELIREVAAFIAYTEMDELKRHMEHESQDFYGDLVRLLFTLNEQNPTKFVHSTALLRPIMAEILSSKENKLVAFFA